MALLLWVAGILAFIAKTPELGLAIWAVVLINAVFSFWQEYQAEQALAALKRVLPIQVKLIETGCCVRFRRVAWFLVIWFSSRRAIASPRMPDWFQASLFVWMSPY